MSSDIPNISDEHSAKEDAPEERLHGDDKAEQQSANEESAKEPEEFDVFISYSRKDSTNFATELYDRVVARNRTAWMDRRSIEVTTRWEAEVRAGIEKADVFAFVISPESVRSTWCRIEVVHANNNGKRIAPILYQGVDDMNEIPEELSSHQFIESETGSVDDYFEQLLKALTIDPEWTRRHTELLGRAKKWKNSERDSDFPLRDKELRDAEATPTKEARSSKRDSSFLLRGKELRDAEAMPAEEARKLEKDPDFKPTLTDDQKNYIRASRRATNRSRLLTAAAATFVLVVTFLGALFLWQKNVATTRALAGQALLMSEQGGDSLHTSVLLAAEARDNWTGGAAAVEAEEVLRRGVDLLARPGPILPHDVETMEPYENVYSVEHSPNGRYVATAGDDDAYLWDADNGGLVVRLKHKTGVNRAVFSPDDRHVATSSGAGVARVFEVPSGKEVASFDHEGEFGATGQPNLAFNPDGGLLATSGGTEAAAFVRDVSTEETVARLELDGLPTSPGYGLAWASGPDGERLATTSLTEDGTGYLVQVWDVAEERETARLPHDTSISRIAFSPDGEYLATGNDDGTARVWDVQSEKEVARMEHEDVLRALAFGPSGEQLATASADRTARVWDVQSGEQLASFRHDSTVSGIDLSPDGERLATSSLNAAHVWDVSTGEELARAFHSDLVARVSFHPDGEQLATASYDKTARLWNVGGDDGDLSVSHEERPALYGVAFSPEGEYMATAGHAGTARVWDLESGEEVRKVEHEDVVKGVAFSPDGEFLATASNDLTARVWDISTGEEVARFEHPAPLSQGLSFSPDGEYLATASEDATARVWHVDSGRELSRLEHYHGAVYSASFSPDGERLATAGADRTAGVWDVGTGEEVARVDHGAAVWWAEFSPDGKRLALGSVDGTAWLADIATEEAVGEVMHHGGAVSSLAFTPDGERLATASRDHTARVWDVGTGEEVARVRFEDILNGVAVSPGGGRLATTGEDGVARVQGWRPGGLPEEACGRLSHNLTEDQWRQYVGGLFYRETCPGLPTPDE